jgi:5-methylcytosine-specific restriction enzyme A
VLFARDRGVCALCGVDTMLSKSMNIASRKGVQGQWWDADHIKPVTDGGAECDLANVRTLCCPCHRSLSARQAHERALRKAVTPA